ncbi:hypothetical protein [Paenibacillus larvae]|nr:hypothetical protein [Paenibacillus larvae]
MKRRFKFLTHLVPLFVLAIVTSGCGSDSSKTANSSNTPESKPTPSATVSPTPKPEDDIWTRYDNAKWVDDFKGLKSEIVGVAVSDKAPDFKDSTKTISVVALVFNLENTTNEKFTTYPDLSRLVTSTGEQLEKPTQVIDESGFADIGGEIEKGVKKVATLVWELKKSKAADIEWIKLQWDTRPGSEYDTKEKRKTYEVELKLK